MSVLKSQKAKILSGFLVLLFLGIWAKFNFEHAVFSLLAAATAVTWMAFIYGYHVPVIEMPEYEEYKLKYHNSGLAYARANSDREGILVCIVCFGIALTALTIAIVLIP